MTIEATRPLEGTVVDPSTGPTTGKQTRELGWFGSRLARGLTEAPREYRAWRQATEYDNAIAIAKEAKDQTKLIIAQDRKAAAIKERRERMRWFWAATIPFAAGGCFWVTLTCGLLLVAAVAAHVKLSVKVPGGWLGKAALAFVVSLVAEILVAVLGMHPDINLGAWMWRPWMLSGLLLELLAGLVVLIVWAGPDGSIADNLAEMAPAEKPRSNTPDIVNAVLATKALPQETEPILVQPGIRPGNGGMIWTATIDTCGPSATALVAPKPLAELAARLGLSTRRLIATVDEDCGTRLHLTGITGQPWRTVRSPLLGMQPIDLWGGIPFGPSVEGDEVTYRVEGVNSLFGGESGAGKSTALAAVWAAFALSPTSRIYAIDGGEVDTEPLRRSGLASGWTTDLTEGQRILNEVLAEVDRRQHLLARAELRKVSPAFFAEHGLGFDLLLIDELATFTQGTGKGGKDFADTLRQVAQRCRKTGIHLILSTQSPSVDAIDADARDVIPVRWAGRARSADLAAKILGKGTIGRGVDPRNLPTSDDAKGVGWFSAPWREVQQRPYELTDADLKAICARGIELRRGHQVVTAADEDRALAGRVSELVRDVGVTVPQGRVMLAREVADRLDVGQDVLRLALARVGVRTQKVSRPDSPSAHNHAHYVLSDLPAVKAV
jgi:hypothetical protein